MPTNLSFNNYTIGALEIMAEQLQSSLKTALESDSYQNSILGIENQCKRLLCRSQEWKSKAFLIIVVGPVKSGKSTFVNLLAHEKVSPTHFLECTVRPSIISRKKDKNEDSLITPFITKGKPTMEDVDAIIDYIKGLDFADIGQIKKEEPCLLTDENLDRKVSYRIGFEQEDNGEVALTSITARGGEFLQDNIFLIDMPGFDGVLANLDKPFYEAIVNRADLVVFVQSSNSAINKISENFCELIRKRNGAIPIYFIHNYFDSAYWHTETEKKKVTEGHIKKALEFFEEHKMVVRQEDCKCINLGKVTDARDMSFMNDSKRFIPKYGEMLKSEDSSFSEMEHKLYEKISSSQNRMRLQNCISRTVREAEILCELLEKREKELQNLKQKYERISDLFDELRRKTEAIEIILDLGFEDNERKLLDQLQNVRKQFCEIINYEARYNTTSTRAKGRDLIRIYRDITKLFVDNSFGLSSIQKIIQTDYNTTFNQAIPEELIQYKSLSKQILLDEENIEIDYSSIEEEYDVEIRIEQWYIRTRKGEEVVGCMMDIEHDLFGLSLDKPCGFIPQSFYPTLQNKIETWIKKIENDYHDAFMQKIENTKNEALSRIISDLSKHEEEMNKIEELLININRLLNRINKTEITNE